MIQTVGVAVFNGIGRLDVEGPLGVLIWAGRLTGHPLQIQRLSKDGAQVTDHLIRRPMTVDGTLKDAAGFDLLVVPGGNLSEFVNDQQLVAEIRRLGLSSQMIASACTGAFLVAQTGLADGKSMTTHWQFRSRFPQITLVEQRFLRDGSLWSSAGISAGIDMALRLVGAVWGNETMKGVQAAIEYFPEPPISRERIQPRGPATPAGFTLHPSRGRSVRHSISQAHELLCTALSTGSTFQ